MMPNHAQSLERLAELSRYLDKATDDYAQLDEESVRAKQKYEVAYARAFLDNAGSMDLRKQIANYETRNENLEYEISAAKVRALKERIRTLGTQIEVGRSLASAHKAQFAAEPAGQYT
jgi:chromosome segregation ATPase